MQFCSEGLPLPRIAYARTSSLRVDKLGKPMKHSITMRIDPNLLAAARACAKEENRSLTNFLETALKQRLAEFSADTIDKRVRSHSGKSTKRTINERR
jgi:hypothetical protein